VHIKGIDIETDIFIDNTFVFEEMAEFLSKSIEAYSLTKRAVGISTLN